MNIFLLGAAVLLLAFVPCGIVVWRHAPLRGIIAVELAAAITIQMLVLLAEGFQREPLYELPMVLAVLSLPASLVFLRFFERWL